MAGIYIVIFYDRKTDSVVDVDSLPNEKIIVPVDPVEVANEIAAGKAVLLDVRTDAELAEDGYALGSTHIEFADFLLGEFPKVSYDTSIYVYCKSGGRAEEAKRALLRKGFLNVVNIGGLNDWESAGGRVLFK